MLQSSTYNLASTFVLLSSTCLIQCSLCCCMLAASTDNTNSIPSIVQGCTVDCTGEQGWLVRAGSLLCMGYYWAGVTVIYNWGVKNQQPAASKYEMEDGWWKRWDRCMFIQRISEGGTKIFAELLTWTKCLVNLQIQNWFKHLKDYLGLSNRQCLSIDGFNFLSALTHWPPH